MTRASEQDLKGFVQEVRRHGDVGHAYLIWWRTVRHWERQVTLRAIAPQQLDHARYQYITACNRASELLAKLEKKGALRSAP
jgi:hypothetical protein